MRIRILSIFANTLGIICDPKIKYSLERIAVPAEHYDGQLAKAMLPICHIKKGR